MTRIKCLVVDDEPRAREVLEIYIQDMPKLQLIGSCKNAIEAINLMATKEVDLIFLDIEMPEISGLALAKTLNKRTNIIFTTAFRDYAVEGFDLRAIDYLLKPIRPDRFKEAIDKYELMNGKHSNTGSTYEETHYLFVRSDRKMVKILLDDIQYIESFSDYLKIHTLQGLIITRETLSKLEDDLTTDQFLRIHRSYIINTLHITAFTKETINIGEHEVPISRSYRTAVHERLAAKSR